MLTFLGRWNHLWYSKRRLSLCGSELQRSKVSKAGDEIQLCLYHKLVFYLACCTIYSFNLIAKVFCKWQFGSQLIQLLVFTVQSCAVGAVSPEDAVGQQGLSVFSSVLSNVEKRETDLPVTRISKVLELPLQRRQGWLEGVWWWCCCCMFAELGRVFLAAFLVFPKGIGHPTFYSSLLLSGRDPSE